MSRPLHVARVLLRVLASEGPRAVRDRLADAAEARRAMGRGQWRDGAQPEARSSLPPPPVLNLSPMPPFPRRGGAQLQMIDRLAEESRTRPVALLYPTSAGWRLEHRHDAQLERWTLPRREGEPLDIAGDAITAALRLTGAGAVHLENPAGLPLALGEALVQRGLRLLVSVHDFSCFCRRPHLIEAASGSFCNFCEDDERCRRCLLGHAEDPPIDQAGHRAAGRRLLELAEGVVFPSSVHLEHHRALFPGALDIATAFVVEPATNTPQLPVRPASGRPHLAMVGGLKDHKGAVVAARMVEILRPRHPLLRITAFGDGDEHHLRSLRRRGARIRGYYRAGTLPQLLLTSAATIACLPSIWPESYGLVVDECLRAGIPVAAFDIGAVGPRLRRLRAGYLAALDGGAEALAAVVSAALDEPTISTVDAVRRLPTPASVASRMTGLYQTLGLI